MTVNLSETGPAHPGNGGRGVPLLEARAVRKRFGGVTALEDVDFSLHPGEVHALLGPNGAGKSTLIKIISGVVERDAGDLRVRGGPVASGVVATVFQELSLIPDLTVQQNILLTQEPRSRFGVLSRRRGREQALAALARAGLDLDPRTPVSRLPIATRQLVEIAKALHRSAQVLILDEPTTSLTAPEVDLLFARVRELRRDGVGIVYVTHRLPEVFEIADRVTIVRDGRTSFHDQVTDLDMRRLVSELTGAPVDTSRIDVTTTIQVSSTHTEEGTAVPALRVTGLSGDRFKDVNLAVQPGQILGIAGLTGSGRSELLETLFGLRKARSGEIEVDGTPAPSRHPRDAMDHGFGLVPEDRGQAGLVLEHSIQRNIAYANLRSVRRGGWLRPRLARESAQSLMEMLKVRAPSPRTALSALSGGNQQKIVFAKWLHDDLRVLLLDEPTRGVDVQSRSELYRVIRELAEASVGVVLVTSDFEELLELSTHIAYMRDGYLSPPVPVDTIPNEQSIQHELQEPTR